MQQHDRPTRGEAPLFAVRVPARSGNAPQQDGAARAARVAGKQARVILTALAMLGPLTREELRDRTGIRESALCGRLAELEAPGRYGPAILATEPLIRKAGRRPARSGVRVWVYEILPAGRRAL